MLNDRDMRESTEPPRRPHFLRIVPLGARAGALPSVQPPRRGAPRSAEEWTALVKIGSGELDIAPTQCRTLRALGLVVTISGRPVLTRHGRYTLGLPG